MRATCVASPAAWRTAEVLAAAVACTAALSAAETALLAALAATDLITCGWSSGVAEDTWCVVATGVAAVSACAGPWVARRMPTPATATPAAANAFLFNRLVQSAFTPTTSACSAMGKQAQPTIAA